MFPFGAVTVRAMSPLRSVVPLTSIVVEPSMPPAVRVNPPAGVAVDVTSVSSSDSVAILLTDGIDNMSKVPFEDVKNLIASRDIKLYAIGIGDERDYNGPYLQALAESGHGLAFGARDASTLEQIYREIDKLEATKIDAKKVVQHTYLYIYPLFLAILMLLLFIYIRNLKGV